MCYSGPAGSCKPQGKRGRNEKEGGDVRGCPVELSVMMMQADTLFECHAAISNSSSKREATKAASLWWTCEPGSLYINTERNWARLKRILCSPKIIYKLDDHICGTHIHTINSAGSVLFGARNMNHIPGQQP